MRPHSHTYVKSGYDGYHVVISHFIMYSNITLRKSYRRADAYDSRLYIFGSEMQVVSETGA